MPTLPRLARGSRSLFYLANRSRIGFWHPTGTTPWCSPSGTLALRRQGEDPIAGDTPSARREMVWRACHRLGRVFPAEAGNVSGPSLGRGGARRRPLAREGDRKVAGAERIAALQRPQMARTERQFSAALCAQLCGDSAWPHPRRLERVREDLHRDGEGHGSRTAHTDIAPGAPERGELLAPEAAHDASAVRIGIGGWSARKAGWMTVRSRRAATVANSASASSMPSSPSSVWGHPGGQDVGIVDAFPRRHDERGRLGLQCEPLLVK